MFITRSSDDVLHLDIFRCTYTNSFFHQQSEAGSVGLPDLGDSIDSLTFEQILEMDDDEEEREFSRSIVFGFFEQAETTFLEMDEAL